MYSGINNLDIKDDIPDPGEHVLEEEVNILIPYLLDKILEALGLADHGDENQSSPIRTRQHREAG